MSPEKYDSCVREINKKIKQGKIKKTYKKGKKRIKTNPYAICKSRMPAKEFNKRYWGKPRWN
jgi:hypothetical protein